MTQTIYTVTYFHPETTNGIEEKTFQEEHDALKFYRLLENHGYEAKKTDNQTTVELKTQDFNKYKFVPVDKKNGIITCEWHKNKKPSF